MSKNASQDRQSAQLPAWAWLVIGIITGLFLAFLYYLAGLQTAPNSAAQQQRSQPAHTTADAPRFDFYNRLKDQQTLASDAKPAPLGKRFSQQHLIQTGAFRSAADADKRRAHLILLGMDVNIETAEAKPGVIFHRVIIGPFDSSKKLAQARQLLDENKIEHIVRTQ